MRGRPLGASQRRRSGCSSGDVPGHSLPTGASSRSLSSGLCWTVDGWTRCSPRSWVSGESASSGASSLSLTGRPVQELPSRIRPSTIGLRSPCSRNLRRTPHRPSPKSWPPPRPGAMPPCSSPASHLSTWTSQDRCKRRQVQHLQDVSTYPLRAVSWWC